MAEKNNSICSICGKEYYACLSCRDSIQLAPWKTHCDTAEHYKVFQIIRGLSTNVYTKDEARAKLKNVNLEDVELFRPHIKKIIKDILKEEKAPAKIIDKTEEPVEVKTSIEEVIIEKPSYYRKRNYKNEAEQS